MLCPRFVYVFDLTLAGRALQRG